MKDNKELLFGKRNYLIMLAGIALVILGFILMSGVDNTDPAKFNEAVYGFRRMTLAPLVILTGFALGFVAIFSKNHSN